MPGLPSLTLTDWLRDAPPGGVQLTVWVPIDTLTRMLLLVPFGAPSTANEQLPPMAVATSVPVPPPLDVFFVFFLDEDFFFFFLVLGGGGGGGGGQLDFGWVN